MKQFAGCKNYTLEQTEKLNDIDSVGYVLRHDKTGARIALIANSDDNKTFVISFNTPQSDSTGVPHILEHSVLCGSKKYPVKDAMGEISKGSLNTFLNALTFPDRTLYPVASCNDKDFHNLMSVYLDAVFYPRVYEERKIFEQEGWHYELDSTDGELTYNGVVYNEMKGAYSSPQSLLYSYSVFSLFPDNQYGVESGGDPDYIPDLSYETFLEFHRKLYNPSNARIFLYGDMDFEEKLEFIDREYLSKFDRCFDIPKVDVQVPFNEPKFVEKEYSVSEGEKLGNSTYLSYNVVVTDYTDRMLIEAFDVIDYALCTAPGSILERRLLDAGIGTNIYSDYTTDLRDKVFSIVAEDANPEDRDKFVEIIEQTLRDIYANGFNKKTLEAAITTAEFSYREADFGYYPKGVVYAFMTLDNWNYTDENIFSNFKTASVYDRLREGIDEGLFEKIVKERILDNTHKSVLVLKPVKNLQKNKENALKEKLAKKKAKLSQKEIEAIVNNTVELKKYQESPDNPDALNTIPTLSLSDINKDAKKIEYSVDTIGNMKELFCKLTSNGIAYFTLSFSMDKIPYRLFPAISVLKNIYGLIDTKKRAYNDLSDELNILSGGLSFNTGISKSVVTDGFSISFDIRGKAFYRNVEKVFSLIHEIIFESDFSDKKRIKELLEMGITKTEDYMIESGHSVSLGRAMTYFNVSSKISDVLGGIDKYHNDVELLDSFDDKFEELIKDMKEAISYIFTSDNLTVALGCEEEAKESIDDIIVGFSNNLSLEKVTEPVVYPDVECLNEGLSCDSLVQYVAVAGNYSAKGLKSTARLGIIRNILSTDYLWNEVRLKGGAYGVYCVFSKTGDGGFMSYRDPNLKSTIEAFKSASDYIKSYDGGSDIIERFIITTIGDADAPLTPSMKLGRAFNYYKMGITDEDIQKERDELLSTKVDDIRALHIYIDAIIETGAVCVLGNEEVLKRDNEELKAIVPLYIHREGNYEYQE